MKEFRIMVMAAAVALLAAGCRDYALKEDLEALNERVAAPEQMPFRRTYTSLLLRKPPTGGQSLFPT